jgi:glycosyltransferase involved in cell wall biosynthesis
MSRLVFVTTELHPETGGGAGVLVDTLARTVSAGRRCAVLLLTPEPVTTVDRGDIEVVNRVIPESGFLRRSEAAARAIADLAEPGDWVEVQDFEGIAYLAFAHRPEIGLEQVTMTVRCHGPFDLLAEAMDTVPDDWDLPTAMEREVFSMADQVFVPTPGIGRLVTTRYQLDASRVVLAPPPVPPLVPVERGTGRRPVFAAVGRLGEMKGSQDLVMAANSLIDEGVDLRIRFIGADGWSPTAGTWVRPWLESMIPPDRVESFVFVGDSERDELPELLADVTAVVVPSRFESFCLAAHEARALGHPLVVADLPAFEGIFSPETGALVYDGSVPGLARVMRELIDDPGLRETVAAAPPPVMGDAMAPYAEQPEPRHPRAQAGLATGATRRVNAVWEASRSGNRSQTLESIYRRLPAGLARFAVKVVPTRLKNRARAQASWPAEVERREREARLEALSDRISAGEFPEVEHPDVTVVVPFYNDIRFVEECLASVYEQTHDSWEVVLVDDGSTEEEAVSFIAALDRPRVRVLRQANRGLPGARNAGITEGRGRFFVPLDSDDELEPGFLSTMIAALDPHPDAGYAHCYARLHHDVDAVFVTRPFNPYWQLLGNGIAQCGLVRQQAWADVGGYDESMTLGHEDWDFWLRLMKRRWGQVQVPEVLYRYRKHGVSMSVDAEARFEEARRMVRDRHPVLYEAERVHRFKRRWYPLVTALTDQPDSHDEIECVEDPGRIPATWGKYVADVRGLEPLPVELLLSMAEALEGDGKASRAVTSGLPPVVMTRRWNLHDPGATPDRVIVLDDPSPGPEPELPSHIPRPGWAVPQAILDMGVPLQRQPPEESGRLVDPSSW